MPPPPPSRAKARRRWVLCLFNPIRAAATSLACNSETEVGFMSFQPLSHHHHLPRIARARWRWIFRGFRPCLCRLHLPRVQKRDGGGSYVFSTPFLLPPPSSHATARRRWGLCRFNPFRITTTSLALQERNGGGFLGGFDPVCAAATSLACNRKQVLEW